VSHDQHTATALPPQHITTHKKRSIAAHARMGMYTARNSPRLLALARVCAYSQVRDRLLFAYGFKDTEPWPQFAQSLQIPPGATGAFWMILGNGMEITGRNWSTAWLKPPSLGFQIYAMEARGGEQAEDVTEAKVQEFVDKFLNQVDAMMPPEVIEGVVEEEVVVAAPAAGGGGGGAAGGADAEAAYERNVNNDKELRKLIAALEMSFNSGIANIKKTLDDVKDSPNLLPGKASGLTSTLTTMDMKVKKGTMDLKKKIMDLGKKGKDEL